MVVFSGSSGFAGTSILHVEYSTKYEDATSQPQCTKT